MTGWNFACADWEQRLREGRSLVPDLPLFKDKADRAVRIFDKLRVPDIEGQPPFAVAAGEWFRDIVRVIFGSLDDEGVRHVPEVFALVGKKNSKTTSGAGLMVTALLMNEVPWAEFLFIGPTQEIADLAFQQAAGMVEADPDGYLAKRFHVVDHKKTIRDRRNKAFVKVKTFDMKVMTGSKPIGVLIDELHVMGSIHYAARVVGQIRGALELKKNSFLLIITTQSDEPPAGVFRAELQYARAVRAGRIVESRMLPLLYEFPEAMQTDRSKPWADPTYWPMVMPNLGRSLHLDTMIAGYYLLMAGPGARRLAGTSRAFLVDGVAILPITGPIFPRANMMTEYSGATSINTLTDDYRKALDSSDVGAILLLVDSPGGAVSGINAFADIVAAGAKKKYTTAFVAGAAASAAYWIASAASAMRCASASRALGVPSPA